MAVNHSPGGILPLATWPYLSVTSPPESLGNANDRLGTSVGWLVPLLGRLNDMVVVQDPQGRWQWVNDAFCDWLGRQAPAVLGQPTSALFPESEAAQLKALTAEVLATGQDQDKLLGLTTSQGLQRVQVKQGQLRDPQGQLWLVGVWQDVTERDRTEATLIQLATAVRQRTTELQTAREYESTLKRITDRVRDSLDEEQILQTAVRELTEALGVKGSNTALYDLEQGTSTVSYEYTESLHPYQGRVSQMEAFPEVYDQLLRGEHFQFCNLQLNPVRGQVAMFACPILDDRGVLGDLWLIHDCDYSYNEVESRLVQQVANQCAIAIRQARLYQAAQSQVAKLEQINTLKDDFLSTVSHELRTPVTSMRVALQLLRTTLNQEFDLESELQKPRTEQTRIARYFSILHEECEREISLINDLLDLQRLDAGNHPIDPQLVVLQTWLPDFVGGFQSRAKTRDQSLHWEISADTPTLVSDLPSLERILAEILNNACKYTPPGETISLKVSGRGCDRICFELTNTGVEIPEAERSRIFDKFYRVPSADPWRQGGTGLGLALVQRLLHHLDGDIQVTSGNQQTCFTIELPSQLPLI